MLDLDNLNNSDIEIKSLLENKIEYIIQEMKLRDARELVGDKSYYSYDNITYVEKRLHEILKDKYIKAYHCTRIDKALSEEGIKLLEPMTHLEYCINQLGELIDSDIKNKIRETAEELEKRGHHKYKKNMIWFVFTKELAFSSGCAYFFKYYGGECVRRIFKSTDLSLLDVLEQFGEPRLIEIKIKISDLEDFHIDELIRQIINFYLDGKYKFRVEGYKKENIEPEDILNELDVIYDEDENCYKIFSESD